MSDSDDPFRPLIVSDPDRIPVADGYLLFAGDRYYPLGGWNDFRGRWPTQTEAEMAAEDIGRSLTFGWWHVVDVQTGEVVAKGNNP